MTRPNSSHSLHARSFVAMALSALLGVAALGVPRSANAQATLITGLGGPADFGTNVMVPNDDGSSASIPLAPYDLTGLCFFGRTHTQMFINNNGNITFNAAVGTYTPTAFPASTNPMIAPWWADVDTRGTGAGIPPENRVYWDIRVGQLVVTWYRVGYYASHIDRRNTFQLVIRRVSGSMDYDVEFRYAALTWTTGDASMGMMGLGGVPAQAGFDAGDMLNFSQLPGSRTAAVLNLLTTSNVTPPSPGLWVYRFRSCGLACVTNADCGGATPICDGTTRRCRACTSATDCSAPTPACATTGANTGRCVQCTAPANCTAPFTCDMVRNLCVGCVTNADCSGSTPICDSVTRACRRCDPARPTDCTGGTPVCGPAGRCVQCAPGLMAACVAPTPRCNPMTFLCVACVSNADCSGATPYCAGTGCVAGAVAITSPATGSTASGRMPTISGTATPGQTVTVMVGGMTFITTADPVTGAWSVTLTMPLPFGDNTATATIPPIGGMTPMATSTFLVPCATAADCPVAMGLCDGTTGRCRACATNADCTAATPVCAPTGSCVLCTTGATGMAMACATNPDGRACIQPAGSVPVVCGCNTDADCGASDSGRVCDTSMNRCIAGCSPAPMRNRCPTGQFCTSTDVTGVMIGMCTTSCNRDSDCMTTTPMLPHCLMPTGGDGGTSDGGTMTNICVECSADPHCAARTDGRTRCIGPMNTCAQCTMADRTACMSSATGSACLTSGLCGCTSDTDCATDRQCDMTTSQCVPRTPADAGPETGTDAATTDTGDTDASVADGSGDSGGGMDAGGDTVTAPDGGSGTRAVTGGGLCNCRVPGSRGAGDSRGAGLALFAGLVGIVIARRRRGAKPGR